MRRKVVVPAIVGVGLLAVAIGWLSGVAAWQRPAGDIEKQKENSPLPIKQVVLFNSGVGYFQREGEVQGNARVELTFPVGDVNDLLKSLVLQDLGGGKISTVSYDSQDPVEKILRSFALDLNGNPTFGQILNQARGEKVEILKKQAKGDPIKITGVIVGLEVHKKQTGKDILLDVDFLNLSTQGGLQSFPLDDVQTVRFLNPLIENEFQRALQVLSSSHDTQKKLVSMGFKGAGQRAVRVGYVVERPIWKTTYRLRMDDGGKMYLQGWAIVENTSDDDWNDVRMVLVSGRPISFKMNLYEPLYLPRPTVEPELFASLRPPVYSGAIEGAQGGAAPGAPPRIQFAPVIPGTQGPGFGGMMGGAPMPQAGWGQFQNQNSGRNRYQVPAAELDQQRQQIPMNKLTYEELQRRRQMQDQKRDEAKKVGSAIAGLNFREGISSVASAGEIGDYYRYIIDEKISLARQKSAMLPILDQTIQGIKVSIFNESTHAKFPLLGLKLKNTSGQPLTQGPITVYEEGTYAGDTRVLDLQPGEERLLSYALDQTTEIKTTVKSSPSPEMHFKIDSAQMTARYKVRETKTYTIKNRSKKPRTLIIEHPIRADWSLVDPKKPIEKSRSVYRFQIQAPADDTITFDVVEEQARVDNVAIRAGQPCYVPSTGIQVREEINMSPEKLVGLEIVKGFLIPSKRTVESRTYFIQNLSDQDRSFVVDHIIPKEWSRIVDKGEKVAGPSVYRFTIEAAKGKTGQQEVVQERIFQDKGKLVTELTEVAIREYLNDKAPSVDVKNALTQVLERNLKISDIRVQLVEKTNELKRISDDQQRLRSNLSIIPQSAPAYKRFLDKFVDQETQIETLQNDIRQIQASLDREQRALDTFVRNLNED